MTTTLEPPKGPNAPSKEAPPPPVEKTTSRWIPFAIVVGVWIVLWLILQDKNTLFLGGQQKTGLHDWFTDLKSDLINSRDDNVLMQFTGWLSDIFNSAFEWLQGMFAAPDLPRPVPQVGWLGVIAIATWITYAISTWRMALLCVVTFLAFGYLGYWEDSIETLLITLLAVFIALLLGFPMAVLIGTKKRADAIITPVLDVMQTMPSFVYLVPFALFFSLGPALAVACTVVYALPPAVRIAGHGIRSVSTTTIEATDSIGQTGFQRLTKVQLPMAKKTIIVGINQTIMAALSMVVIAALVDGPGLGKPVLQALQSLNVGVAFVAGLCIVFLAIFLDRTTTAASERSEAAIRSGADPRIRRIVLGVGVIVVGVCVYVSRTQFRFAEFPESSLGPDLARKVQEFSDWVTSNVDGVTSWMSETTTNLLINPLQDLIATSPWWVTALALLAISLVLGGWRAMTTTVVCLIGLYYTDLWYDSMVTLTIVLVATLFVMVLGIVFGVWMARSRMADRIIRPVLDAAQVMPPFVYLIPALALFEVTRFTGIVAAVIYAAPVAIKLVADGIKAVSPTTIEAATAAGAGTWQIITKVQIPMAKSSLVLATNQGLLYVLSMVVIAGLVGAGALGYDVSLGFSQGAFFGKGLAAGIAIVLLGVMIDRIARRAAERDRESSNWMKNLRLTRASA